MDSNTNTTNDTANTAAPIADDFTGNGGLFNVKTRVENGPSMDGHITADGAAEGDKGIRIAAFPRKGNESGVEFFSLAIGEKGARVYGALFPNGKKQKDGQPDYTGSIDLAEGKKLFLAGWNKTGEKAGAYISIKVEPARAATEAEAGAPADGTEQAAA